MPCDTVTVQSVALQNAVPDIMLQSLQLENWTIRESTNERIRAYKGSYSVRWVKGSGIQVTGGIGVQTTITEITKAYSREAVTWAAKRCGWTVANRTTNQVTLTRR